MILANVDGTSKLESTVLEKNLRVMPGCKIISVQTLREVEQRTEFYFAIATHARIRRLSAQILRYEIIDDFLAENVAEVDDVKINAERFSDARDISNVRIFRADLHCHADDFIALPLQKSRSQRTVHTAAHRD